MFNQQHRAKATEFGELVKISTGPEESREFQNLERRFASLADNEQILADDHKSAVQASNHEQSRGTALAVEEDCVLRYLGAALIMQWNTLPTTLQREVFDTAGSMGKLLETAALRGQIARFLHKHKDDRGCAKLTPTEDTHSAERLSVLALSRWDDERGAVRDGLPKRINRRQQGGFPMSLTQFGVDDGPHNMDGLRLFAQDGSERIEAFIGRKVMDVWAESVEHCGGRQSLFRGQYNALGKLKPCSD